MELLSFLLHHNDPGVKVALDFLMAWGESDFLMPPFLYIPLVDKWIAMKSKAEVEVVVRTAAFGLDFWVDYLVSTRLSISWPFYGFFCLGRSKYLSDEVIYLRAKHAVPGLELNLTFSQGRNFDNKWFVSTNFQNLEPIQQTRRWEAVRRFRGRYQMEGLIEHYCEKFDSASYSFAPRRTPS